jgi:hypothetical protein
MVMINGDPGDSVKGWQGDGIDVEIEWAPTRYGDRYLWVLYDRAREVTAGATRTARGARWASTFARWRYRRFSRRA